MASLEDRQKLHNRVISAVGNQSASNNYKQHANDSNSKLIASAEAFAAGRTLGMSEEETLAQMSKMLRRQQRKDQNVTCLLYTSPSPRDGLLSRMPSSA